MSHPGVWPRAKMSHYITTVLQGVFIFNLLILTKNNLKSTYGIVMSMVVKG